MTTQDRQIIKFLNKTKKKHTRLGVGYYNDDFVLFSDGYIAWTRRKDMLDEALNDYITPMGMYSAGKCIYDLLNNYHETRQAYKETILINPKSLKEQIKAEKAKGNKYRYEIDGLTKYTFDAEYVYLIENQLYTQSAQLIKDKRVTRYPILLFENDLGERALILPIHNSTNI